MLERARHVAPLQTKAIVDPPGECALVCRRPSLSLYFAKLSRLPIPRLFQPACRLPTSTLPCYRLTTTSGTRFLMISITSKIQPLGVRRKATLRSPKPAEARTGSLIGTAPLAINFSTS